VREQGSRSSGGGFSRRWAGIAASLCVIIAPILIGGGPAWAQATTSAIVFAATAVYLVLRRGDVRPPPFSGVAALAVVATAVQLLPLPAGLVQFLSPRALALRTDASRTAISFLPLTVDVPATVLALTRIFAAWAVLLLASSAARSGFGRRVLVWTLAFVGGGLALVNVVQRALGVQSILGLYPVREMSGSGVIGTFVNGNHASSLLALSALTAVGLAAETVGPLRTAAVISAGASMVTVISTGSRTGTATLALGLFMLGAHLLARRFGPRRALLAAGALIGVATVGAIVLADGLRTRLLPPDMSQLWWNQKTRGWATTVRLIRDYALTGVGRGAFEAPASAYRLDHDNIRLVYPENIGLQLAAEWGLPLALALATMFTMRAARLRSRITRLEPALVGAACGVLTVLLHDLADMGLELLGVALPVAAAVGLVAAAVDKRGGASGEPSDLHRGARWLSLAGWAVALAGTLWAVPHLQQAEGVRLAAAAASGARLTPQVDAAIRRHPADYYLELLAAQDALAHGESPAGHLNRALLLNPANPAPHRVTARWLARNGRRAQAALEYRLAFEGGLGTDQPELLRAVGQAFLADTVPQQVEPLMTIARFAVGAGQVKAARVASDRAVELAVEREAALQQRVQVALGSKDAAFQRASALALLAEAQEPRSFISAGQALLAAGDPSGADGAMKRAIEAHPRDASTLAEAARIRAGHGDYAGARSLLASKDAIDLTFEERQRLEEILADIAQRQGDLTTAAAARARAHMLDRIKKNTATAAP
jgi:O-antigen ligase